MRPPRSTLFPCTTLFRSAAVELLDDRAENSRVHVVEAERVDVEHRQRLVGDRLAHHAVAPNLREIAHAPQQAGGDARRADRKSTRLNSSHSSISYAVFCL